MSSTRLALLVLLGMGASRLAAADERKQDADAEAKDPPIQKPQNPKALEHLAEGNKLYALRRWAEAADEYTKAYLLEPAPILEYNLGQTYRQMGKNEDAVWHYQRFVLASPQTPMHVRAVQGFVTQLQAQIEAEKATKAQPPSQPAPMSADGPSDLPRSTLPAESPKHRRHGSAWYTDTVGLTLGGVGVVGVGIGGWLLLDARSLRADANQTADQTARVALNDKADTRRLLGGVLGIGGVGFLVAATVKLVLHARSTTDDTLGAWNVSASPDGVMVFGQF